HQRQCGALGAGDIGGHAGIESIGDGGGTSDFDIQGSICQRILDGAEVFECLFFIAGETNGDESGIAGVVEQIRILGIEITIDLGNFLRVGAFSLSTYSRPSAKFSCGLLTMTMTSPDLSRPKTSFSIWAACVEAALGSSHPSWLMRSPNWVPKMPKSARIMPMSTKGMILR